MWFFLLLGVAVVVAKVKPVLRSRSVGKDASHTAVGGAIVYFFFVFVEAFRVD